MRLRVSGIVVARSMRGRNSSRTAVQLIPPNVGSQYWSRMVDQMNSKDSRLSRFCSAVRAGCAPASVAQANANVKIRALLNSQFYKLVRCRSQLEPSRERRRGMPHPYDGRDVEAGHVRLTLTKLPGQLTTEVWPANRTKGAVANEFRERNCGRRRQLFRQVNHLDDSYSDTRVRPLRRAVQAHAWHSRLPNRLPR